jgi:endoglucanase
MSSSFFRLLCGPTRATLIISGLLAATAMAAPATSGASPLAHAAGFGRQQCGMPYSGTRDPSNPLALPVAPGGNPLNGARFFVPGPAKGAAGGAIASALGINPLDLPVNLSWASFSQELTSGRLALKLATNPALAHEVAELSKIASQPEAQRLSSYSWGGSPDGIFKQAEKIFCSNMTADPGTVPIFNTYFLHPQLGGCPTPARVRAYNGLFHARVDAMAAAVARRPAVFLLELDAIGSSSCVAKMGSLRGWEADLRYEAQAMQALPHTVVYVEGGYSDSNTVRYTARVLRAIGVNKIRGFFTNDTHEQWTINEVRWSNRISRLTHGAHYIVNTADNGRGPLLNPHPITQGVEDLCNPPNRGLGPTDTTHTRYTAADGFLWTHPPGNSSGCGGGPPGGVFWVARAVSEAENANNRLGPAFPNLPY